MCLLQFLLNKDFVFYFPPMLDTDRDSMLNQISIWPLEEEMHKPNWPECSKWWETFITHHFLTDAFTIVVVKLLSHAQFFWIAVRQAPLSMEVSRQEYWSELPFPSPGDLPDPGIKTKSPELAGGFFTSKPSGPPREHFMQRWAQ